MKLPEASTREAYGQTLLELGRENPDIVVLDADLSPSTYTSLFGREFPERFFDVGIAEQNMFSIAAGLSSCGKIVFCSTFAVFATCKGFDQLRICIAQPRLNVKVVATHGGISVGQDGISHHAIEDIALICSLPGFRVIIPADAPETREAVREAASNYGPFYIRLLRPKSPVIHKEGFKFNLGKAEKLKEGEDITIIACGLMVAPSLEAADELEREGISCRVLNMSTVKPIDEEAILAAGRETRGIVVVEEHLLHGGLGSIVAQLLSERHPTRVSFIALRDTYARSGTPEELFSLYGFTVENIVRRAKSLLSASL